MLQTFDERNRDLVVNVGGRLVHRDDAGVSPFDSVVQGGDAVWEGLRVYDGRVFRLTEHLDRLRASALAMAFTDIPAHEAITHELARTLTANDMRDGVHVRLTLTRGVKYTSGMDPRLNTAGPTLIVLAEHKPPVYDRAGVRLITSGIRRIPPDCVDQNIHSCNLINSILAKIQANAAGVDDALMLDLAGAVAETNATHVFVVHGDVVATPRTTSCPEGITRAAVLGLCAEHDIPAVERDLSLTDVYRADEMFCTGTMGELVPVTEVDGRTIGGGAQGPVTARLREVFAELVRTSGTPLPTVEATATPPGGFGLHHVQVAMPRGAEDQARAFYGGLLGLTEVTKPPVLAARGGVWFRTGGLELHLGIEDPFTPARKAHPGILVADPTAFDDVVARLRDAGVDVRPDDAFPGHRRCYVDDCFGNRLELLTASG